VCISEEVSEYFASSVLSLGLFVVHDPVGGGEDNVAELSGREDVINELFEVRDFEVESWGDNSALVKSAGQLNHDLSCSLIVNNSELSDVPYATKKHV
jgi:hypothetical protein